MTTSQKPLDNGRPDEDPRERLRGWRVSNGFQKRQVNIGYEALHLSPEVVSLNSNVKSTDEFLAALLG